MKKNITINFVRFFTIFVVVFFCNSLSASAASLSLSPASGTYSQGDDVTVQVVVSSPNESINAVSGTINFPTDKLQLISASKGGSIINFWAAEPTFSNSSGKVRFEGVILNPGFKDSRGVVLTLYMRAKAIGSAPVVFGNGVVLANDGQGTDVTQGLSGATFSINEAKVVPKVTVPVKVATTTEVAEPVATPIVISNLKAPEILLGTKYGAPAVIGTSDYAKSQVLLTFVAPDGAKIFITGATDEDGGFSLLVPNTLKRGLYKVTAVIVKNDSAHSAVSNEVSVQIGNMFSDISWQVWCIIALLVLMIIYLTLRVFSHIGNSQKLHSSNKRKVHDAENLLHKSFNVLRQDLADHEGEKKTITERKQISAFKKDMEEIEKVMDEEIKDLES